MTEEASGRPAASAAWQKVSALVTQLGREAESHVPGDDMMDYAVGALNLDYMDLKHGAHLKTCIACREALELYGRNRPKDPLDLQLVPEFANCSFKVEKYQLLAEQAKKRLIDFVDSGDDSLLMVSGEANPAVYDEELEGALRRRSERAARRGAALPRIICGPAMGLNDQIRTPDDAILPRLSEDQQIVLLTARRRQRFHYRVSDDHTVYTEAYHSAGSEKERTGLWAEGRAIARLFRRRFEAMVEVQVAKPASREDFVYGHIDAIRALRKRLEESGDEDAYDRMTAEDLRAQLG